MMNYKYLGPINSHSRSICFVISLCILAGCASDKPKSSSRRPAAKETFSTEITADGSKRFSYSLETPTPKRNHGGAAATGKRKSRGIPGTTGGQKNKEERRDQMRAKLERQLDDKLSKKMEETGFCQDGYLILDRLIRRGSASVRGECREGANDGKTQDESATS